MRMFTPYPLLMAICACSSPEERQPEPGEVERYTAKIEADEAKAKAEAIRQSRAKEQELGETARARTAAPRGN